MAKWKIYHNPKCSKSRQALAYLADKSIDAEVIEYLKETPSIPELEKVFKQLALPVKDLVRTKEAIFKEAPFDLEKSDIVLKKLSEFPKLIERPIIIKDDQAVIGRPTENIDKLLDL